MRKIIFVFLFFVANSLFAQTGEGWVKDKKTGCKYFTFGNADKRHIAWTGKCANGFVSGQGTLKMYEDGILIYTYVGNALSGKSNGQGTYTWAGGDKYVGQNKDGKSEGQGTYTWADGRKYVGQWKDNKKEGQGTFTWPDGDKYEGEWKDDKYGGLGTYFYGDYSKNLKFVGRFEGNTKIGTLHYKDGRSYTGKMAIDAVNNVEYMMLVSKGVSYTAFSNGWMYDILYKDKAFYIFTSEPDYIEIYESKEARDNLNVSGLILRCLPRTTRYEGTEISYYKFLAPSESWSINLSDHNGAPLLVNKENIDNYKSKGVHWYKGGNANEQVIVEMMGLMYKRKKELRLNSDFNNW